MDSDRTCTAVPAAPIWIHRPQDAMPLLDVGKRLRERVDVEHSAECHLERDVVGGRFRGETREQPRYVVAPVTVPPRHRRGPQQVPATPILRPFGEGAARVPSVSRPRTRHGHLRECEGPRTACSRHTPRQASSRRRQRNRHRHSAMQPRVHLPSRRRQELRGDRPGCSATSASRCGTGSASRSILPFVVVGHVDTTVTEDGIIAAGRTFARCSVTNDVSVTIGGSVDSGPSSAVSRTYAAISPSRATASADATPETDVSAASHLTEFDPDTTNLDLMVCAPDKFELALCRPPHEVAGSVHATRRVSVRRRNKLFGG